MNLHKGLNRVFILLGLVAAVFGCLLGGHYAENELMPSPQKAFQSISWNDQENINKYYLTAKNRNEYETEHNARVKKEKPNKRDFSGFTDLLSLPIPEIVKTEDLPNYKKVPPQYNEYVFEKTFPNALKTPAYKVWIGIILGALFAFCLCYGGLHSVRLVFKWIISGFKDK